VIPSLTSDNGPVQNLTKDTRYDFISQAVQDANEGDVIVAAQGTYHETLDFGGKSLFVRSQDPNDPVVVAATIIDGGSQAVVFAGREDANCVLAGFTITGATQGVLCSAASPTILNCRIACNAQAGVRISDGGHPTLANCTIEGSDGPGLDMTPVKGGRFVKYNYATVAHCVIVGNAKEGILEGRAAVVNSIIYLNGLDGETPQINAPDAAVRYCDVERGYPGTGNISEDPGFVKPGHWTARIIWNASSHRSEPVLVWSSGDYHLAGDSPCINAGDPEFAIEPFSFDIDGQPRLIGGRADIGCDEAGEE
jgi:parallel beta-helix repeat protein